MKSCALVCCSDGRKNDERELISRLELILSQMGVTCTEYGSLFCRDGRCYSDTPQSRAMALCSAFSDGPDYIFDISGGNIANEMLPYLDYDVIASSRSVLWGYSDLTSVINAVFAVTGKCSVLYQIKNLVGSCAELQQKRFRSFLSGDENALFSPRTETYCGQPGNGIVIGGNLRCFLKLAGTPYFPGTEGRILLLESLSADEAGLRTGLSQLGQMGVFENAGGVICGSFSRLKKAGLSDLPAELISDITKGRIPVMQTDDIGHGSDSMAVRIGSPLRL